MNELLTVATLPDRESFSEVDLTEQAERLASRIRSAVLRETGYAIRGLLVEVTRDGIRLSGHCDSYYSKQLAQHAAMAMPGGEPLCNCIEVS